MPVNIAIDFDGTFTALPEAWMKAIDAFRAAGANVFCISSRFPNVPITGFPGTVYYSCGQDKWEFAHAKGIQVDIWVDDWPSCIGEHPERRGQEPPQATQRRHLTNAIFQQLTFGLDGSISLQTPAGDKNGPSIPTAQTDQG